MFNDSYDFHVDTNPMAETIDYVSERVNHTTTTVAAMQTAVIAQEVASTTQICTKLDVGFFNVVMGQIAQKVANERAKNQALAMELMQQQKALQNLQNRMGKDYTMIAGRYGKLFTSLNQELKNRITELDRPLIEYCTQNIKQLENRIYGLVSSVPVNQSESLAVSQNIAAARIKSNAQNLISSVTRYLVNDKEQRDRAEELQIEASRAEVYYVPLIVDEETTETRSEALLLKENPSLKHEMSERAYQQLVQSVGNQLQDLEWKDDAEKRQRVYDAFLAMIEEANPSKRVKDAMISLFDQQFKTL